jgi:Bacterial PH domain
MSSGLTTRFSTSYDTATKVMSAVACLVLLIGASAVHNLPVACLALAIFGLGFAYSPREYVVSNSSITVKRLVGDVFIPLEGMREARAITKDDLRGCIRLWGSGGLFGYYGLFRTRALGICSWYVTNRSQAVVMRTAAKTVLFSPDDKDGFLLALRDAAPTGSVFTPEPFAGIQPSRSRNPAALLIGIAIALSAAGLAAWAILYSPGPPAYTLTRDKLTIHDKFYPVTLQAVAVDVAHVHVVDLAEEPDWRPVARTNGFANAHYRSGWFRAANGRTMRLYQAGGTRLVLLPPNGNGVAVLYQADAPDEFVREITGRWSDQP